MGSKTALVTGANGQDGSYLCELLLEKNYEVFGMVRRSSVDTTERLGKIINDPGFEVVYGDVTDATGIHRTILSVLPDEVYNLAAMSQVKVSFDQPVATFDVNAVGVLNILEAVRQSSPGTKVYQASSSELYGETLICPQNEETPFMPRSPYGVAKLAAFHLVKVYREAYGIFACNGILFNHETIVSETPMIYKDGDSGEIDIVPISDIVRMCGVEIDKDKDEYQAGSPSKEIFVWDYDGWTKVKYASAYPHDVKGDNKRPVLVNTSNAVYAATSDHIVIMEDGTEKKIQDVVEGDRVSLVEYPTCKPTSDVTSDEAMLIGALAGDGHIPRSGMPRFISSDKKNRDLVGCLWDSIGGGGHHYRASKSGFSDKTVGYIDLNGNSGWGRALDIYTEEKSVFGHRYKKVPKRILNAPIDIQRAFLDGYNMADGLKAGRGSSIFKNFKTNSPVLAAGLLFLVSRVTKQKFNITVETSDRWGKTQKYYSINFHSSTRHGFAKGEEKEDRVLELTAAGCSQRSIHKQTNISRGFIRKIQNGGHADTSHRKQVDGCRVKKIVGMDDYDGWFYDLETESGTFHCGVGLGHVHNSPRRGGDFVTRKITKYVGEVNAKISENGCFPVVVDNPDGPNQITPLRLGNLEAKRDWSHAKDMVRGMWMMLQQDKPDDFVLASGKTRTIKDFLTVAFSKIGVYDWEPYVVIDQRFFRPAEVSLLCGDYSKAEKILGWTPEISFEDLVSEMVTNDLYRG